MTIERRVTKRGTSYKGREAGKSLQSPTLREVLDWKAETRLNAKENQPTYGDLYKQWQRFIEVNRSKAYADTQRRAHARCTSHFDDWPWYEVTKSAVLTYLDSLPLTNRSRNEAIGNISYCFSHFVRRDVLDYNPLDKIPKYGHETAKPHVPSIDDFQKLFPYMEEKWPDRMLLVDFCLETGCRVGEVVDTKLKPPDKWLRWEDCKFQVDPPLVRLWTKKTKEADWTSDDMPISQDLATRLKAWKLRGLHDGEHVFPWTYSALKRWLRRCCISVKIEPFGWHSFRHFFAHHLDTQDGVGERDIQGALRHRNPNTTLIYLPKLKPSHDLVKHTFKRDLSLEGQNRAKGGRS